MMISSIIERVYNLPDLLIKIIILLHINILMGLTEIIIVVAIIIFFLYMMKDDTSNTYVAQTVPQDELITRVPEHKNVLIETLVDQSSRDDFAPYITQPNDARYVFVPNLGVYLLPYEHLNLSIPYHQWMYSHFPSYYGEYYDNYWPFDDSVGGAKYVNSFDNSHWGKRQGNRQNRQNSGRYWDKLGGNTDDINGNRWSSFNKSEPRGRCQ